MNDDGSGDRLQSDRYYLFSRLSLIIQTIAVNQMGNIAILKKKAVDRVEQTYMTNFGNPEVQKAN